MIYGVVVALGVALVALTFVIARGTSALEQDEVVQPQTIDPDDPWSAFAPRPMEELDRRRTRMWPALSAVTGLVLIGAGLLASRAAAERPEEVAAAATDELTPAPYLIEVRLRTPAPTPDATPEPTAEPTAAPAAVPTTAPAAPAPSTAPSPAANSVAMGGPAVAGQAGCSSGTLSLSYTITATSGRQLKYFTAYLDGGAIAGGPISGSSHNGGYEKPAGSGDHEFEVVAEDASGGRTVKRFQAHCG